MDYRWKENNTLSGVGCDVSACKYHGGDCKCHAERISIESGSAVKKGDTFCATFCAKCE